MKGAEPLRQHQAPSAPQGLLLPTCLEGGPVPVGLVGWVQNLDSTGFGSNLNSGAPEMFCLFGCGIPSWGRDPGAAPRKTGQECSELLQEIRQETSS